MSKGNPQLITKEQAEYVLLKHVADMVDYWAKNTRVDTDRERLEGLAFSMLVMLDGGAMATPAYLLVPYPHEEDRPFAIEQGYDYYPDPPDMVGFCEIAGGLHEKIHKYFAGEVSKPEGLYTFADHMREDMNKFRGL